jgi:hypothetical protein
MVNALAARAPTKSKEKAPKTHGDSKLNSGKVKKMGKRGRNKARAKIPENKTLSIGIIDAQRQKLKPTFINAFPNAGDTPADSIVSILKFETFHHAIVFADNLFDIQIIRQTIANNKIPCMMLNGEETEEEQQAQVKIFRSAKKVHLEQNSV